MCAGVGGSAHPSHEAHHLCWWRVPSLPKGFLCPPSLFQPTAEAVCRRIGLLDGRGDARLLMAPDPHALPAQGPGVAPSLACLTAVEFDGLPEKQQAEAVQQLVAFCRLRGEGRGVGQDIRTFAEDTIGARRSWVRLKV